MVQDIPPTAVRAIDRPVPLPDGFGALPVQWWVPTAAPVIGVAWLQHGYARSPKFLRTLAGSLAAAGLLVALPTVESFRRSRSVNDVAYLDAIGVALAALTHPDSTVHEVARRAEVDLDPDAASRLVLVAHSAGCAVLARAAKRARADGADLAGLVVLDATENLSKTFADSLPGLAGVVIRGAFAKPSWCNRKGQGARALRENRGGFVGVRFTTGTHCDAEGEDSDRVCRTMCGRPEPENVAMLHELTTAWSRALALGTGAPTWEPGGDDLERAVASGRLSVL